jgi:DNA-binding protein HU-beta
MAALAEATGMSKKEVGELMDKLASLAYKHVKSDGEFTLPGFGKLVKVHRAARQGRNPATGETIQIPAKTVVKFRVAKAAKDALL